MPRQKGALARKALKVLDENKGKGGTKRTSSALQTALDEVWETSQSGDKKAWSTAITSAMKIARNSE